MKKKILVISLFIVILLMGLIIGYQYKKNNTSFLKSVTILGEKFDLKPGIFVYELHLSNNKITKDDSGTGCNPVYTYEIDSFYGDSYTDSGIRYFKAGEIYADFRIMFTKNERKVAYYYFIVTFDEPLEIADGC